MQPLTHLTIASGESYSPQDNKVEMRQSFWTCHQTDLIIHPHPQCQPLPCSTAPTLKDKSHGRKPWLVTLEVFFKKKILAISVKFL